MPIADPEARRAYERDYRRQEWRDPERGPAKRARNRAHYLANRETIRARARERQRAGWLLNVHGMTVAEYDELYRQQEGRCAICRQPFERLVVDHNHATGARRGLLCNPCNRGLGYLGDDPQRLIAAAAYLAGGK